MITEWVRKKEKLTDYDIPPWEVYSLKKSPPSGNETNNSDFEQEALLYRSRLSILPRKPPMENFALANAAQGSCVRLINAHDNKYMIEV